MDNSGRVRRIFDSLPEPANWTAWIKFTILQTGAYKPFLQQCSDNTTCHARARHDERRRRRQRRASSMESQNDAERAPTSLAQALGWERLARLHYRTTVSLYLLFLAKYRLISMVSGEFRSLDCFILGRLRFIGRLNRIGGEFACLFILGYLANRVSIHLLEPKFKYYVLEFLMSNRAEILSYETTSPSSDRYEFKIDVPTERRPKSACPLLIAPKGVDEIYPISGHRSRLLTWIDGGNLSHQDCATQSRGSSAPPPACLVGNSVAYLRCPFTAPDETKWILRLNRTAKSWARLKFYTKILFYWSMLIASSSMALIYYIQSGAILTNFGFEMSYPACVAWLRDLQSRAPGPSELFDFSRQLYLAPKVLAYEIPIDEVPARIPLNMQDLPPVNVYTIVRILMDILECHLIYVEGALLFVCQFYLVIIYSVDVVLNATAIRLRLIKLLDIMEARSEYNLAPGLVTSPLRHLHHSPRRQHAMTTDSDQLREEISEMQAILADHFNTITQGYNLNISFLLGVVGLCWLLYTVIVCTWMSSNRSQAVELEFMIAELMTTIFCSSLTIGTALVRSRNLQLYQLITRAMALDPDWSLTKPRWTSILSYFYPKSFYCFTIFGSIELSVLLGLKLMSWILSAFIVLANFFHAGTTLTR